MAQIQTIREVTANYKQLTPADKLYVSGVMQGLLIAKGQMSPSDLIKTEKTPVQAERAS